MIRLAELPDTSTLYVITRCWAWLCTPKSRLLPLQSLYVARMRLDHLLTCLVSVSMLQNRKTKPDDKFWIIHGCIFRPAFGQVTSGEMVDTSSGIRTTLPDCDSNLANEITPHPAPLASTRDDQDWHISEIQGKEIRENMRAAQADIRRRQS